MYDFHLHAPPNVPVSPVFSWATWGMWLGILMAGFIVLLILGIYIAGFFVTNGNHHRR